MGMELEKIIQRDRRLTPILFKVKKLERQIVELKRREREQEARFRRKSEELMAIRELGHAIHRLLDVDKLRKVVISMITKKLKGEVGSLMFIDRERGELVISASVGVAKEKKERYRLKIGEGLAGWCVEHKEPILCYDMEKDPRFKRTSNRSYRKREFMCAPLISKGDIIGVVNIEKRQGGPSYTTEDLEMLKTFVDESVASFENAFLFEDIQRAYYATIKALVIAMEAKDPYARGHGERVGRYAVKIARVLGLSDSEIEIIKYFSMLHDIGKIGVPEEVLLKPGKLTAREWELMRKHPSIGESIIEPIGFLKPVRELMRHHHEWYNGRGYPDRLKGEEIAIAARILSVADAYDAMLSDRPYRKALSKEKALEEIKKASGTQFDPKVVRALIEVVGKKK